MRVKLLATYVGGEGRKSLGPLVPWARSGRDPAYVGIMPHLKVRMLQPQPATVPARRHGTSRDSRPIAGLDAGAARHRAGIEGLAAERTTGIGCFRCLSLSRFAKIMGDNGATAGAVSPAPRAPGGE
jgi:hypothetical protein